MTRTTKSDNPRASRPANSAPKGRLPRQEVDQRIDRLLDIALEEFAEHGFAATSLDRLVALSGVSKTTIFRRFGSKENLFLALLDMHVSAMQAQIWAVELEPDDPHASLARYADIYIEAAILNPIGLAILRALLGSKRHFPQLNKALMDYALATLGPFVRYLGVLTQKGVLRCADLEDAALEFQAMCGQGFRSMADDPAYLYRPGRSREIAARFLKAWA